jgi:hypothetical protein
MSGELLAAQLLRELLELTGSYWTIGELLGGLSLNPELLLGSPCL